MFQKLWNFLIYMYMFKVDVLHTLCTHAGAKMTMEKRSNKCWRWVSTLVFWYQSFSTLKIYFGYQRHIFTKFLRRCVTLRKGWGTRTKRRWSSMTGNLLPWSLTGDLGQINLSINVFFPPDFASRFRFMSFFLQILPVWPHSLHNPHHLHTSHICAPYSGHLSRFSLEIQSKLPWGVDWGPWQSSTAKSCWYTWEEEEELWPHQISEANF